MFKKNFLANVLIILILLSGCGSDGSTSNDDNDDNSENVSKGWGAAELIGAPLSDASYPQVGIDDSGKAIAVWRQADDNHDYHILANKYDGIAWGTPEILSDETQGVVNGQDMAYSKGGNAIVAWIQPDGTDRNIWACRYDGTLWGAPELITSIEEENAYLPQIALNESGVAIITWVQSEGIRFNVWANKFDGFSWDTPELIGTNDAINSMSAQVALDESGIAIITWVQEEMGRDSIWARFFDGISWGVAELLETDNENSARTPRVAFDGSGSAISVWLQSNDSGTHLWATRFNGTGWSVPEQIDNGSEGHSANPSIALDESGTAIVVWEDQDFVYFGPLGRGTHSNIWANRYNGFYWEDAELIEVVEGSAIEPQVDFGGSGEFLAIWAQNDGGLHAIKEAPYNSIMVSHFTESSWDVPQLIENYDEGHAYSPSIALSGSGNAVAIWKQRDGQHYNIWANKFE